MQYISEILGERGPGLAEESSVTPVFSQPTTYSTTQLILPSISEVFKSKPRSKSQLPSLFFSINSRDSKEEQGEHY
jgi:hypothetical protein